MPDHNKNLHNKAKPSTYEMGRILRREQTKAEEVLWQALRNRKVAKLKFRREHAFENYVQDFYCHEVKLAVEADGSIHDEPHIKLYDMERTKRLNECGISVLRFSNYEIEKNSKQVINNMEEWVKQQLAKK